MLPRLGVDRWPILCIDWPKELDLADVEAHFDEVKGVLSSREGPFAIVVNLTGSSPPNAVIRKRAGERVSVLSRSFRHRLKGIAYVVPSAFARGVVTAIHWFARVDFPVTAVAKQEEAFTWATQLMRDR